MVTRLFDILNHQKNKYPKKDALVGKENGEWKQYSIDDLIYNADAVSLGLLALGIVKGDKVATISNNRPEWNFIDFGILQIGAVHVPIYPTISENDYRFILNDCEAKIVFVSDEALWDKIHNVIKDVPSLKHAYTFNKLEAKPFWKEIIEFGKNYPQKDQLQSIKDGIIPEQLATMIYTSGTTGNPKGVMLSHHNLVSNFIDCEELPPVDSSHKAMSFLPLCHVYERMLTYLYMYIGVSIYYAESIEKVGDNLKELKPDVFSAVPRLIEKVFDKIMAKGKELHGIKRWLFYWAVNLAEHYEMNGANGAFYEWKLSIARKLIFSKWKEALGGNVRVIVSGGAALQVRLARIFWAAGIPILEGYGLTETSPVISVNFLDPGMAKFGTVGTIIKEVKVKIAEDGEILCKGPNVMIGYYKRPDLTAEVIDAEGWFHTGDIGTIEDGKFLKITDRKKEIFKTSGGKFIAPQPMESIFKESPFIENIMVIGENQKYAAGLVVPSFNYVRDWCKIKGHPTTLSNSELIKQADVRERIWHEIEKYNTKFGKTEQLKKIELVDHDWTVTTDELTPTLKLKRKKIMANNKELVDSIYKDED